jgi:hypothetical protein
MVKWVEPVAFQNQYVAYQDNLSLHLFTNMSEPVKSVRPSAVGTPVTRRPPHSPRRAVFPHRVPRLYSLPRQATTVAWFAIPRSEVGLRYSSPTCPAQVSFAGSVLPSGPSPCTWLSHAPSTMPDKTPQQQAAGFPFDSTSPPACLGVPSARLGYRLTPCPGFPFRASIAVYLTVRLSTGRSRWDLPGSLTPLFLHATA